TGPDRGRHAAQARCCGRAGIPGRIHDGQWIAPGSRQGPACHRADRGEGLHDTGSYSGDATAMPTQRKSARLWLRPARRDKSGRIIARATYLTSTAGGITPRDALRAKLIARNESLPPTLPRNTKRPGKTAT